MPIERRHFVLLGGLSAAAGGTRLAKAVQPEETVHLVSDGTPMQPREYARLLARLTEAHEIAPDTFSRDGVVAQLEQRMAAILGKEAAVFVPTGTLANHLAIRLLANGRKVLVQKESHLYWDEGDCAQRLSGLNLIPLAWNKAAFTLADVQEEVDRAGQGRVDAPVGAISIESPVRRKSGEIFPFDEMKRIAAFARQHQIGLHLDGARLFIGSAYTGIKPAEYAALFDTVYVSLYKYFNASFGAVLAGPRSLLENLYHTRRMFGGGLPHVWPEATVALHFLDGFEARFAKAVAVSEGLLGKLAAHPGFQVERVSPGSNVAFVTVPTADPQTYQARLRQAGIVILSPQPAQAAGRIRFQLTSNETLLRRPPEALAQAFFEAV